MRCAALGRLRAHVRTVIFVIRPGHPSDRMGSRSVWAGSVGGQAACRQKKAQVSSKKPGRGANPCPTVGNGHDRAFGNLPSEVDSSDL